jgi:hypothetical protein
MFVEIDASGPISYGECFFAVGDNKIIRDGRD